jgi:hypothetical protein
MSLGIRTNKYRRVSNLSRTEIDGHQIYHRKGDTLYVDASASSSGDGKSWDTAFTTMQEAFNVLVGGETIFFTGKITEQLVTPVQIFDVTVVGAGNRPRHADSTPSGGNTYAAQWAPPASGATVGGATVQVLQQGWAFENILFTMESATAPGINLVRNAASGNSERDASHAIIRGCKFAGAGLAIRFGVAGTYTEIVNNVLIEDNDFFQNTTAISESSALQIYAQIIGNRFQRCTNDIVLAASHARILNNTMSLAPTASIVISGGTGSSQVHGNFLPGTYANGSLYAPGTNDNWNGNAASTGYTAAVPA